MDSKLKKWIIIVLVICIILFISMIILLSRQKDLDEQYNIDPPISDEEQIESETNLNRTIELVQSEEDFFTLEKQIQNYLLYLKVENQEAVYNLLDTNYIQRNDIAQENVINNLKKFFPVSNGVFSLKQAYVRDSIVRPIYYTHGIIGDNEQQYEYYIIVYWDQQNHAYALKPINSDEYKDYISDNLKEENNKEIASKKYNKLDRITLSEEDKAIKYFNSYIQNALYNIDNAYNSLEQEYSKEKFENIEQYKQYIKTIEEQLSTMDINNIKQLSDFKTQEEYTNYLNNLKFNGIKEYKFINSGGKKKCICIDAYGNYYIFNIMGAMQYTIILDTYTIDLPEFTEKYNSATDENKVLMNIQRVFNAINDGDYKYAYNKLDPTFRTNNFKTLADFENYVKKNFFSENKLASGKVEKQSDIYLYDIIISDASGKNTNNVNKTFVMQLKQGTDFVMSFNVK